MCMWAAPIAIMYGPIVVHVFDGVTHHFVENSGFFMESIVVY